MRIAILGYGKEGKCAEKWLKERWPKAEIKVFDGFGAEELKDFGLERFDLIVRTPSVSPKRIAEVAPEAIVTSVTKLFFEHCPCQIIGVTGTKGKGTTASMIRDLLTSIGRRVWLVGNIGTPALDILSEIDPDDIVVYELSSFQLWDLEESPHIAVVLRIEPDHLNVHDGYEDYVNAKMNIVRWQTTDDICVYYGQNAESKRIAAQSKGHRIVYPADEPAIQELASELSIVGKHNRENAEAAIIATAATLEMKPARMIEQYGAELADALKDFKGLPHRLEFVAEKDGVKYYDDSFSSAFPAMSVAIDTFLEQPTIIIAGGLDRGLDLTTAKQKLFTSPHIKKVVLIGETSKKLADGIDSEKFTIVRSLEQAVEIARAEAKKWPEAVVLLSPGAASFDMFKDFAERGEKFQRIVRELQ